MEPHDLRLLLRRLEPGGWTASARRFAGSLRTAGHEPGQLLVVGTRGDDPWHLTAHLEQTARLRSLPCLQPVLVRWQVPDGAPAHLSVGRDAVARAGRRTTVLIAADGAQDDDLLQRLHDARQAGAVLLAVHPEGGPLDDLAHDTLAPPPIQNGLVAATHAVSSSSLHTPPRRRLFSRSAA